jgi:hypothetical protein
MLFGVGATAEERAERRASRRSILHWISQDISSLMRSLGQEDQRRMDRYLENVREIERRIEMVEAQNSSGDPRAMPEAPRGVPDSFSEHMEILFDLQVLALQTDMTRVISFKTGRDSQNRVFPESNSDRPFHPASHHGNREEAILDFNEICKYRVGQLPYLLEKLQNTEVEGGNLLDQSVVMWGSPMGDANVHNHRRCPLMLLGKGNGMLEGNLHLQAEEGTPMSNAMLSVLNGLGMDMDHFGDSTGEFSLTQSAVEITQAMEG